MSPGPEDVRHEPGEIAGYDAIVFPEAHAARPAVDDPATDARVFAVELRELAELLVNRRPDVRALSPQAKPP